MPDPDGVSCTSLDVDGTTVTVRTKGKLTTAARDAIGVVARAAVTHLFDDRPTPEQLARWAAVLADPHTTPLRAVWLARRLLGELEDERKRKRPDMAPVVGFIVGYRDLCSPDQEWTVEYDGETYSTVDAARAELVAAEAEDRGNEREWHILELHIPTLKVDYV